MKEHGNWFEIVKTVHHSKLGEYQKSAYQMNNSVPSTDRNILISIPPPSAGGTNSNESVLTLYVVL